MLNNKFLNIKPSAAMKTYFLSVCFGIFAVLFISCNNSNSKTTSVTAVDTIQCWVDSSLQVLAQEQTKAFHNIYKFPRLQLSIYSEADIVQALIDNKVNLAILHRLLDSSEMKRIYKKENFMPKQYEYAFDAYVLVTSTETNYDSLDYSTFRNYFFGKAPQLETILVENIKSQSLMFLKNHFELDNKALSRLNSLGSLTAMMQFLRDNKGAIGILPFSLISDIEAEKTVQFLKGLKILKLNIPDKNGKMVAVEPSQSSIATKEYPLISPIVLVNCNMDKKSGTNFVNYIFKTKAQRLIQQFGLCPAVFPGREIVIQQ